jgi:hypothetical protein
VTMQNYIFLRGTLDFLYVLAVLPLYLHENIALTRGEIVRKIGDA